MDRKQELFRIFLGLNALGHPLYREQISGSPQFLHMHDWPFCNHFSSWVFFFSGYNFGRCPVLKQYPFCSVAVGTFQPYPWKFRRGWSFSSNYTHDTYSTICSGFRYLKHKQRDWIIFHRQSGGSRSGSPPQHPWKNGLSGWFQSLACATAPGAGLCPVSLADWWKFDLGQCLGWDGSNAFDGWWELQKRRE